MTESSTRSGKGKKDATKSNIEIYLEFLNLEPKKVKLSQVFLDPNNPRIQKPKRQKTEERRIMDDGVQGRCLEDITDEGIENLIASIKISGFWTTDRVVLRPLDSNNYVVVEGNRRIASLKTLSKQHIAGETDLPEMLLNGILEFESLIYNGKNPDIAWIIQGFRHGSGIKEWEDFPTSVFLATIQKETKSPTNDIASTLAMNRGEVNKFIRSYYAFQQAKEDDDYGDKITTDDFGHFHRVILASDKNKEWTGWNDKKLRFTKTGNLKKYLKWATSKRITISPRTRDTLAKLVQPENKELLEKFDSGEKEIENCEEELREEEKRLEPIDVSNNIRHLKKVKNLVDTLPIPKLQQAKTNDEKKQKRELLDILKNLVESIRLQIKNLES